MGGRHILQQLREIAYFDQSPSQTRKQHPRHWYINPIILVIVLAKLPQPSECLFLVLRQGDEAQFSLQPTATVAPILTSTAGRSAMTASAAVKLGSNHFPT